MHAEREQYGLVVKLVYTFDLRSNAGNGMRVQVSPGLLGKPVGKYRKKRFTETKQDTIL